MLDKTVAKKYKHLTVKSSPATPLTMLKQEIVLLIIYRPITFKGGGGEEYRFAKGFNPANLNKCIS